MPSKVYAKSVDILLNVAASAINDRADDVGLHVSPEAPRQGMKRASFSFLNSGKKLMLKRDVVRRLAELHPQLGLHGAEKAYQAITQRICQALHEGDRVELRDFGTFSAIARSSRQARNPLTGTAIEIPAKLFVQFRTGRSIRKRLNGGED